MKAPISKPIGAFVFTMRFPTSFLRFVVSLGETGAYVTNPLPYGNGIRTRKEHQVKEHPLRGADPAGILLRLQALARREATQCYESLSCFARNWIRTRKEHQVKEHPLRGALLLGAPAGTRIPDPLIKSQMLYQLSYRGILLFHA